MWHCLAYWYINSSWPLCGRLVGHAARALCDVLQLRTENESNWPKRPITTEQCLALSHICYTKRNIQRKTMKQAQIEWSEGYVTKDDAHFLFSLDTLVWSKALDVLQRTVHDVTSQFAEKTAKTIRRCNVGFIFDTPSSCSCWSRYSTAAKKYLEHEKCSMRRGITTYVASLNSFFTCLYPYSTNSVTSNPCANLFRPWEFQEFAASSFQSNRHMKLVRLSVLGTGRLYPTGNMPGTHFT